MSKISNTKVENDKLLEDLFRAYFDARKNKRNTKSALLFELNFEENIFKLYDEIKSKSYQPGKSIAFVVQKPVKREVFAAEFRDRIVHHLLFNYLNPIFEPLFIGDSYSCRKARGTLYGIRRAEKFMRSASDNYQRECYSLKLDIRGYFMNIDKDLLFRKIEKQLIRSRDSLKGEYGTVRYLLKKIIYSDPTLNYEKRGKENDWRGLPKSKSLFYAGEGRGLPIGNLTSQLFGNIYLNDFDNFIKRNLRVRHYGRYVDDMVFFSTKKKKLLAIIKAVRNYLLEQLGLELHPNKIYLQNIEKGLNFLGAKILPYRTLAGKRLKGNFIKAIHLYCEAFKVAIHKTKSYLNNFLIKVIAVFNSYLGMIRHFNTFNLRIKYGKIITGTLSDYLKIDRNFSRVGVLVSGGWFA